MTINYIQGDLFTSDSPILCHACNCYGSWGGGIAVIFRKKFPESYKIYQEHCKKNPSSKLLGTTLLIKSENGQSVACFFTSDKTGAQKLPPAEIVKYTDLAMNDLKRQLSESGTEAVDISMPKINAGLFAVPWEDTEAVLKKYDSDFRITVYEFE